MPFKVKKVKGGYRVSSSNSVHAKKTSKKKAKAQLRLLNAVEYGGWQPTGRKAKKTRKRKVKWS